MPCVCSARDWACMHARSRGSRIVWTNANADKEPIQAVSLRGAIELVINPSPSNYSFYLYPRPDLPTVVENYANITLAGEDASVGCSRQLQVFTPKRACHDSLTDMQLVCRSICVRKTSCVGQCEDCPIPKFACTCNVY